MKKTILILFLLATIGLTGCVSAAIEKDPVIIPDTASLDDQISSDASGEDVSSKATEEISSGEKEKSSDLEPELVPESMTIEIEGMKETIHVLRHKGDGYEILYDKDRFEYSDQDGRDTFIAENPDPAIYPYVYVTVNRLENKNASDYVEELSNTLSKNGLTSKTTNNASIGNYKGTRITAQAGSKWNSIIRNYYIIEKGNVLYTIESQYFVEAAEGYGARIQVMLDTLKIKE